MRIKIVRSYCAEFIITRQEAVIRQIINVTDNTQVRHPSPDVSRSFQDHFYFISPLCKTRSTTQTLWSQRVLIALKVLKCAMMADITIYFVY